MNSIMSCLSLVGKFVSEFARLILFIASLIVLASSILLLAMSFVCRDDFAHVELAGVSTIFTIVFWFSIYLVVLSAVGIFASFFSNRSSIKLLALLMAFNVVISIGVLASSSNRTDSLESDLVIKLTSYQEIYDWAHTNKTNSDIVKATKALDAIQHDLECCGVHSPSDWEKFRPKDHLKENILPKSCCVDTTKEGDFCDADKWAIHQEGCLTNMERAIGVIALATIFMVCFCFVISILASFVLCCNPQTRYYENYGY